MDLSAQYIEIQRAARETFERLAVAGDFVLGEELAAFEREFAAYCGVQRCVGVASGTDALTLVLRALDISPDAEVITAANTFVATAEAIAAVGARVALVDADPVTRCMSSEHLEAGIQPDTAAVIPVHLFGYPAPMTEILRLCADAAVPIVEDAAQAHGATLHNRSMGAWGTASTFSFYPTKNLGAMGDGGAVVTDDRHVATVVSSLRDHGSSSGDRSRHERIGGTSRLDNLQSAMLRLKLEKLDDWNQQRRRAAQCYRQALEDLPLTLPPADPPDGHQVYHLFVVELDQRDRVLEDLRTEGIQAGVHYRWPIHLQPAWRGLGYAPGDFPVAERLARRALSLPLYPGIGDQQIEQVTRALKRALSRHAR
jgi:dTDP-4-amino-4,6-dideoxygalactose transaminase